MTTPSENQSSGSIQELHDRLEVIDGTIREVRSSINELSQESEEFISFRLFDKAKSLLTRWIWIWIGAFFFFIGITGVVSYIGVVNKASDHFSRVIMPKLEDDIRQQFIVRVNQIVDRESADLSERFQEQFQNFAEQLSQKLEKPKIAEIKTTRPVSTEQGWAYLGNYEKGTWVTRYFEFPENSDPSSLVQTSLEVSRKTGALNVRKGMPNPLGQFPQVIDVLRAGTEVKILEVKEWYGSGYMWARIKYGD
jgi:hypothetical protein